jgi:hypothetical protein
MGAKKSSRRAPVFASQHPICANSRAVAGMRGTRCGRFARCVPMPARRFARAGRGKRNRPLARPDRSAAGANARRQCSSSSSSSA